MSTRIVLEGGPEELDGNADEIADDMQHYTLTDTETGLSHTYTRTDRTVGVDGFARTVYTYDAETNIQAQAQWVVKAIQGLHASQARIAGQLGDPGRVVFATILYGLHMPNGQHGEQMVQLSAPLLGVGNPKLDHPVAVQSQQTHTIILQAAAALQQQANAAAGDAPNMKRVIV